jgi:hypothetical protein
MPFTATFWGARLEIEVAENCSTSRAGINGSEPICVFGGGWKAPWH